MAVAREAWPTFPLSNLGENYHDRREPSSFVHVTCRDASRLVDRRHFPPRPTTRRPPASTPTSGSAGAHEKQWDTVGEVAGAEPLREICSHHGAKLDENRTSTLANSTIMQSVGSVCRLVVISPTVSTRFP